MIPRQFYCPVNVDSSVQLAHAVAGMKKGEWVVFHEHSISTSCSVNPVPMLKEGDKPSLSSCWQTNHP